MAKNTQHKQTVFITAKQALLKEVKDIAGKTGLRKSQLLSMAAEAGWPLIMNKWRDVLRGI